MKVLVTGATGFLGGWLVKRLLDEGCDVRIIKRANSSLDEIEGLKLDVMSGDVTDLESLREASRGVDTVFHLAGLIGYSRAQRAASAAGSRKPENTVSSLGSAAMAGCAARASATSLR